MANTDRENYKFKIWMFDASILIPLPILGIVKTWEFLQFTLVWIVFCGVIGSMNMSVYDFVKWVWGRRTAISYSRLKNERQ